MVPPQVKQHWFQSGDERVMGAFVRGSADAYRQVLGESGLATVKTMSHAD
jgi:hypothetical protein